MCRIYVRLYPFSQFYFQTHVKRRKYIKFWRLSCLFCYIWRQESCLIHTYLLFYIVMLTSFKESSINVNGNYYLSISKVPKGVSPICSTFFRKFSIFTCPKLSRENECWVKKKLYFFHFLRPFTALTHYENFCPKVFT